MTPILHWCKSLWALCTVGLAAWTLLAEAALGLFAQAGKHGFPQNASAIKQRHTCPKNSPAFLPSLLLANIQQGWAFDCQKNGGSYERTCVV